jgi:oligoendopeptidase F
MSKRFCTKAGTRFISWRLPAQEPLVFLRSAPMEFCEVASMSMELAGQRAFRRSSTIPRRRPRPADHARRESSASSPGWRPSIRFSTGFTPIPATPHGPNQSNGCRLARSLRRQLDWTGLGKIRPRIAGSARLHLFHARSITSNTASRSWARCSCGSNRKEDPRGALANYRAALKLGGTRTLPELFAAAGIRFLISRRRRCGR